MKRVLWMIALLTGMWASWGFSIYEYGDCLSIGFDNYTEYYMWWESEDSETNWEHRVFEMWLAGCEPGMNNVCMVIDSPADASKVIFLVWVFEPDGVYRQLGGYEIDKAYWDKLRVKYRKGGASYSGTTFTKPLREESND